MKSKLTNAKTFIVRNYLILFSGTVAATAILGVVISVFQMKSVHELYVERIKKIVFLHENEFLNEIALDDFVALDQHLEFVRSELVVDAIFLKTKDRTFSRAPVKSHSPDLTDFFSRHIFFPFIGVDLLKISFANDFDSVRAVLMIDYRRSFAEWVLGPFWKFSFSIFVFALLPVGLIFFGLFRKINKLLLLPLQDVIASFQSSTRVDLSDIAENALGEIRALAAASEKLRSVERTIALSELAGQVAHDIRSPLSALDIVLMDLQDIPEAKRLLVRSATQRIKDVANNLIEQYKVCGITSDSPPTVIASVQDPSVELLSNILESIVSEKRIQVCCGSEIEIECALSENNYGLFAKVNSSELKRILSNLINNSFEAVGEKGLISVQVDPLGNDSVSIRVVDNGKGIPREVLGILGERGVTYGKQGTESGSGLGIHNAKSTIERWGGEFLIESEMGTGTTISIVLPRAMTPKWFVERLPVEFNSRIVVIDDDQSVHEIWNERFQKSGANVDLVHLYSPSELSVWIRSNSADLFLVDFEFLGQKITGLDLIESFGLGKKSILVTSRFEQLHIQSRCEEINVGLIPKNLTPFIGIALNK